MRSAYKTLIKDLVPEPITQLLQDDVDDQDWLFSNSRKQQDKQEFKKHKADNEEPCSTTSTLWPQVRS